MKRKYPAIDLLKLLAGREPEFFDSNSKPGGEDEVKFQAKSVGTSHQKWNKWLAKCLQRKNLEDLIRVRYGLMVGADDLNKQNLMTQDVAEMYCRWIGSIERTARKIIQMRQPFPKDPDNFNIIELKRKRDLDFEVFLRRSSF